MDFFLFCVLIFSVSNAIIIYISLFSLSFFIRLFLYNTHAPLSLGVENNNLAVMKITPTDNIFTPIVERYVDMDLHLSSNGISISFAGNPLLLWNLVGLRSKDRAEWANVVCSSTEVAEHILIRGSAWKDPQIIQLASMLPKWTLRNLFDLGDNELGEKAANAIAKALPDCQFTELRLPDNNMDDIAFAAIAGALPSIPTIIGLYVTGNNIADAGATAFAHVIPLTKLTNLWIDNNKIGDVGAAAIAGALSTSNLDRINLGKNINIGHAGAQAISEALPTSKVTFLELHRMKNIGNAGISFLSTALPTSVLDYLDISGTGITYEGVANLCTALSTSDLRVLHIEYNNIGDAEIALLSNALSTSNLTSIYLSKNNITDAGATVLAKALLKSKLTVLELDFKHVGDAGAIALANVIADSKIVKLIFLMYDNNMEAPGIRALASVFDNKCSKKTSCLTRDECFQQIECY